MIKSEKSYRTAALGVITRARRPVHAFSVRHFVTPNDSAGHVYASFQPTPSSKVSRHETKGHWCRRKIRRNRPDPPGAAAITLVHYTLHNNRTVSIHVRHRHGVYTRIHYCFIISTRCSDDDRRVNRFNAIKTKRFFPLNFIQTTIIIIIQYYDIEDYFPRKTLGRTRAPSGK